MGSKEHPQGFCRSFGLSVNLGFWLQEPEKQGKCDKFLSMGVSLLFIMFLSTIPTFVIKVYSIILWRSPRIFI